MRARAPLSPLGWLPRLTSGLLLGSGAFFLAAGLAAACVVPTVANCRIEAVAALPDRVLLDPDSVNLGDVRELATRLRACNAQDAGSQ